MNEDQSLPSRTVEVRLAGGERERVVARLSEAYATDALSIEDFERRVEDVYRASSSEQLMALVADLPAQLASGHLPVVAVAPAKMVAVFSSMERSGAVQVPQRLEIRTIFGNVELDLTNARFAPGLTEISIRTLFGNVEIHLPPDIQVENHGGALLGNFECHQQASNVPVAGSPEMRLRITGRAVLGNVEITNEHARRE